MGIAAMGTALHRGIFRGYFTKMAETVTSMPFWRDVQFRLEYGALRFVVGIFRALPLSIGSGFSAAAWCRLAPIINPKLMAQVPRQGIDLARRR